MGVNRARLEQVINELGAPASISRDEGDADILLILKGLYRKQPDRIDAALAGGMPVYMLRSGGVERIREALSDMFHITRPQDVVARRGGDSRLGDDQDEQDDADDVWFDELADGADDDE